VAKTQYSLEFGIASYYEIYNKITEKILP
jgi:hypothetical protein